MTLGIDEKINGVNLGNWLVLEKWMKPELFEDCGEEDEIWMHRTMEPEALEVLLKKHRDSYVTVEDFREIARRGYNLVRIPVRILFLGTLMVIQDVLSILIKPLHGLRKQDFTFSLICILYPVRKMDMTMAESQVCVSGRKIRKR